MSRHDSAYRARIPVFSGLVPVLCLYVRDCRLAAEYMQASVLTHAPVVLLRAEEAMEEEDGRSIVSIVRFRRWFVEVVGDLDAIA